MIFNFINIFYERVRSRFIKWLFIKASGEGLLKFCVLFGRDRIDDDDDVLVKYFLIIRFIFFI